MQYRSFVARYWAQGTRELLLGGVRRSQSSRWGRREDAERYLAIAVENNGGPTYCVGEVVELTELPPEIFVHCGQHAQAVGGLCPGCRKKLTWADARASSAIHPNL